MKSPPKCKLCGEENILQFRLKVVSGKTYFVKQCRACEAKLSKEYYLSHKEERVLSQKKYIAKNRDLVKAKKKEYDRNRYPIIKKDLLEYQKIYRTNNRSKINDRKKKRVKSDPAFKLRYYISARICKILGKFGHKKKGSCIKHLDFSFKQLKEHLEKQFETWMNWNNQGMYDPITWNDNDPTTWRWQVDHIIPVSTFKYSSMEDDDFKKCWALLNLRPLSAKQNHIDGVKRNRHGK